MEPQTPVAPAPPAPAPQADLVPQQWPGAFGIFKAAQTGFKQNWGPIVLVVVAMFAVSVILSAFSGGVDSSGAVNNPGMYLISQLLSFIVSVLFGGALTFLVLKSAQNVKETMVNALSVAGSKLLSYLVQSVVVSILLVLSFIAFIVPFFFVMPRLMMAQYFLFDKDMGPIESIKASWAATKGHAGKVWGLIGLSILCALTGILIITLPITFYLIMVVSVATAILYYWIARYGNQTVAPTAPVAPVAPTPPTVQ